MAALLCSASPPAPARAAAPAADLMPPVKLQAAGKAINVEIGHAAPFVADLNGKRVLLVGQFGKGKLRIYPITGDRKAPRLENFTWFQADGKDGKVPSG
jgi:hypothetical protein